MGLSKIALFIEERALLMHIIEARNRTKPDDKTQATVTIMGYL